MNLVVKHNRNALADVRSRHSRPHLRTFTVHVEVDYRLSGYRAAAAPYVRHRTGDDVADKPRLAVYGVEYLVLLRGKSPAAEIYRAVMPDELQIRR